MVEIKTIFCLFGLLHSYALGTPLQGDQRVSELEAQLLAVTRRLQDTSSRLDDITGKFDALVKVVEKSKHGSFDIRHIMKENEKKGNSTRQSKLSRYSRATESDQVAFTAMLQNKLENIPVGTTIVFDFLTRWTDEIITYDTQTGVFTCPQSGLYLFSVFIQSAHNKEALVQVMMDGKSYSSAVSEPSRDGEDDTGGNIVLLDVKEGSRVWVETVQIDGQSLWAGRTTFSGVLIHRDGT